MGVVLRDSKGRFVKGSPSLRKGIPIEVTHKQPCVCSVCKVKKGINSPSQHPAWKGRSANANCLICNKQFRKTSSIIGNIYCSKLCSSRDHSKKMKGRKVPYDVRLRISLGHKKRVSQGIHRLGDGTLTPIRKSIRECFEYKIWRTAVFERDNYTCTICSSRSGEGVKVVLNADHYPMTFAEILKTYGIDSRKKALLCDRLWDTNNGRTLCIDCHRKTPSWGRPNV